MIWCEHCRDHFPEDHYDERGHKVGDAYGPVGAEMAELRRLKAENAELLEQYDALFVAADTLCHNQPSAFYGTRLWRALYGDASIDVMRAKWRGASAPKTWGELMREATASQPGGVNAAYRSPFRKVVDAVTRSCGCACHTGTGYRTSCEHCSSRPRSTEAAVSNLLAGIEQLEERLEKQRSETDRAWEYEHKMMERATEAEEELELMERALALIDECAWSWGGVDEPRQEGGEWHVALDGDAWTTDVEAARYLGQRWEKYAALHAEELA